MTNSLENLETLQSQNTQLKSENQKLKSQLEEYTQGGIKILFSGKANAQRIARQVKPRTLREIKSLSINSEENSHNLVIEGDNLKTMATLYQYHGKIDLIIADPPYNTGKDFRYSDKWDDDINDEGLGDYVKENDPSRHTKWMKFMLPRIQMMRSMLKKSGILAICIDYRELFNLGKICDEVFGENNRLAIINWQKATVNNMVKHVSVCIEYALVYAKNKENTKTNLLPKDFDGYQNDDNDQLGSWVVGDPTAKDLTLNNKNIYAIQNPFTGELIYPRKDATSQGTDWRNTKTNMKKWLEEYGMEYEERDLEDGSFPALVIKGFRNFASPRQDPLMKISHEKAQKKLKEGNWPKLVFSKQGLGRPGIKRYLKDVKKGKVAIDYWNDISIPLDSKLGGSSAEATHELRERINERAIGVKPLKLFKKIIQLWCPPNGLVLDPFAGTGTTGEAVLQINKETQTNRSFILIETGNEENEDNYCRTLLQKRLQAAITGKWADKKEHESLNGNFIFYSLNKTIDAQTLLEMKRDDLIDAIIASQIENYWTKVEGYQYLFAKTPANTGVFLIWNGNHKSQLTEEIYYQIVQEAQGASLSSKKYLIYACLCSFRTEDIDFEQIPTKILQNFRIE